MPAPIPEQTATPLPVYAIGHAGVNLLFDPSQEVVRRNLAVIGKEILELSPRPRAILTLSGHFTADPIHGPEVIEVNVKKNTHIQHDFVNDFHDSRPSVYEYEWPHLDAPELAQEVWAHLKAEGFKTKRVERGVDHGVWVPFKVAFPESAPLDIPIVQVSTFFGDDLTSQLRLGRALAPLRQRGFLIIGSGMTVHSFEAMGEIFGTPEGEQRDEVKAKVLKWSRRFDTNLRRAVDQETAEKREQELLKLQGPDLAAAHPTVEHLTPYYVAAAAAGDAPVVVHGEDSVGPGMAATNFRWG